MPPVPDAEADNSSNMSAGEVAAAKLTEAPPEQNNSQTAAVEPALVTTSAPHQNAADETPRAPTPPETTHLEHPKTMPPVPDAEADNSSNSSAGAVAAAELTEAPPNMNTAERAAWQEARTLVQKNSQTAPPNMNTAERAARQEAPSRTPEQNNSQTAAAVTTSVAQRNAADKTLQAPTSPTEASEEGCDLESALEREVEDSHLFRAASPSFGFDEYIVDSTEGNIEIPDTSSQAVGISKCFDGSATPPKTVPSTPRSDASSPESYDALQRSMLAAFGSHWTPSNQSQPSLSQKDIANSSCGSPDAKASADPYMWSPPKSKHSKHAPLNVMQTTGEESHPPQHKQCKHALTSTVQPADEEPYPPQRKHRKRALVSATQSVGEESLLKKQRHEEVKQEILASDEQPESADTVKEQPAKGACANVSDRSLSIEENDEQVTCLMLQKSTFVSFKRGELKYLMRGYRVPAGKTFHIIVIAGENAASCSGCNYVGTLVIDQVVQVEQRRSVKTYVADQSEIDRWISRLQDDKVVYAWHVSEVCPVNPTPIKFLSSKFRNRHFQCSKAQLERGFNIPQPELSLFSTSEFFIRLLPLDRYNHLKLVAESLDGHCIRVATGCSGSDVCIIALKALLETMSTVFGVLRRI